MPELQEQRDYIINELSLGTLSPEEQDAVIEGVGDLAMKRVLIAVLEVLPEEKRDEFEQLILAEKDAELQAFIQSAAPNVGELIQNAITETIEEHKRLIQEAASEAPSA